MLHWRLMSVLARALLVAAVAALLVAVALAVAGIPAIALSGVVVLLLLGALIVRRRDLNAAIAAQLRREDEETRRRDAR